MLQIDELRDKCTWETITTTYSINLPHRFQKHFRPLLFIVIITIIYKNASHKSCPPSGFSGAQYNIVLYGHLAIQ